MKRSVSGTLDCITFPEGDVYNTKRVAIIVIDKEKVEGIKLPSGTPVTLIWDETPREHQCNDARAAGRKLIQSIYTHRWYLVVKGNVVEENLAYCPYCGERL